MRQVAHVGERLVGGARVVRGPDDQCSGTSGAQDEYRRADRERLADLPAAGQDRSSGSACVLAVGAFGEQEV